MFNACEIQAKPALLLPTGEPKRIVCEQELNFRTVYSQQWFLEMSAVTSKN